MAPGKCNIRLLPPSLSPWSPQKAPSRQIAVLMSGGVDSSVSAHLLREDGWDVLGITMKIPVSCSTGRRGCCGADAAFVCNELNIPHYFVDVTDAFQKLIIEPFRQSYAKGQTPNPCVDCNTSLKFSLVWDLLHKTFGINYLATGHYARVVKTKDRVRLGRARDRAKDQSYFIYGIAGDRLERIVLPLGELAKDQVRSIARQLNLSVADKPESMELCFAGQGDYRSAWPGDITNMQGKKIGTHKGVANYTIGQRRGIGFAGGSIQPLYVARIDAKTNTVALGTRDEVSFRTIRANQINALIPEELVPHQLPPTEARILVRDKTIGVTSIGAGRLFAKIRSYGPVEPCRVLDASGTDMTVQFDEPQFAPCPGQKLVLYDNQDSIVAGGTITAAFNRDW